jgi:hypothetical protein
VIAYFDFSTLSFDKLKERVRIWERIVDVQKHFNDLTLKIRGLAVAVLGVVLTGAAFSVKENIVLRYEDVQFNAGLPLVVVALAVWFAFYCMDHWWYHRLLIGAVKQGVEAEMRLKGALPEIQLTIKIGETSVIRPGIGKFRPIEIHSADRLVWFYLVGAMLLVLAGLFLLIQEPFGQKAFSSAVPRSIEATPKPPSSTTLKGGGADRPVQPVKPPQSGQPEPAKKKP